MTPSEIQKRLKDASTNQRILADQLKVHPVSVSDVVNGKKVSARIMRAIAEAIHQDVRRVYPWYFNQPPKRKTSKVTPL